MARQRFIWPDIWTDPTVARLQPVEMLFFIGCFSNADDDGRLMGDPAYLRATIFPYQRVNLDEVLAIREKVVSKCDNLQRYRSGGLEYLAFRRWGDYQKPKYPRPSKLPKPPGPKSPPSRSRSQKQGSNNSGNVGGTLGEASGNDSGNDSGNVPGSLPLRVGLGKQTKELPVVPSVVKNSVPLRSSATAAANEISEEERQHSLQRLRELSDRYPIGKEL